MTFTFDPGLPSTRDEVRAKIGDTDSGDVLLQDETLDALLVTNSSVTETAIAAVKAILAKFARDSDKTTLGITSNLSQKSAQYRGILRDLEMEVLNCAQVDFGGASRAEIENIEADSDFIRPRFRVGQHDNPGTRSPRRGRRGDFDGC